ncbi:MAG: DNA methyltransferase [Chloroflexia bacterium]
MLASTTAQLNRNTPFFDWYLMPEAYSAPLVYDAIEEFGVRPGETVLDPFCGTGTTLLAARKMGRNGLGIEVNPFLCFAGKVKTQQWRAPDLLRLEALSVLAEARVRLDKACEDTLLQDAIGLPDMPRRERWIALKVACKVVTLRECIERNTSEEHRPFFMLALASILRGASNMKLSPHAFGSREVKQDAPVLAMFEARVEKMLADVECAARETIHNQARTEMIEGDVRRLSGLQHPLLPARLAVCSPPYLNNLDYTMQTRLELFFLGFVEKMDDLKALRKRMMICDAKATYRDIEDWRRVESVRSIVDIAEQIDDRLGDKGWGWDYGRMTRQYFGGLLRAMEAIRLMLEPGATLMLILGESAHAGVLVPVPQLAAELGELAGYTSPEVRFMRTRRSSSHGFKLNESAVILRNP